MGLLDQQTSREENDVMTANKQFWTCSTCGVIAITGANKRLFVLMQGIVWAAQAAAVTPDVCADPAVSFPGEQRGVAVLLEGWAGAGPLPAAPQPRSCLALRPGLGQHHWAGPPAKLQGQLDCLVDLLFNHLLFNHLLFNHLLFNHLLFNHLLFNHLLSNHLLSNHLLFNHLLFNHLLFNYLLSNHLLFNHLLFNHLLSRCHVLQVILQETCYLPWFSGGPVTCLSLACFFLLRSTLCYIRLSVTCLVVEMKPFDSFMLIDQLLA